MKIGILTRRAGFNMGSSLQAYAMAKFITDTGYSCRIIDYDEYSGHPLWKVRPFVENIQWNLIRHLPFRNSKYSCWHVLASIDVSKSLRTSICP